MIDLFVDGLLINTSFWRNQFYFSSSNLSTDTTVVIKDYMQNQTFAFCFKITIKWNLTKSHATRLKSDKHTTHVIKEQLLKWIRYNKMNQSHGLSYDETLFLSYQKALEVKISCSYSKEDDLYWLEDSPLK